MKNSTFVTLQFSPEFSGNELEESGLPTQFRGACYSGGLIPQYGQFGDAAIDLSSLKLRAKPIFALVNHDPNQRAGNCQISCDGAQISVDGRFLSNECGQEVAGEFKDGAPWEFSVKINATAKLFDKPTEVLVNGRSMTVNTLFTQASVREVSFVPAGADPNTQAIAFAKEDHMTETNPVAEPEVSAPVAQETVTVEFQALLDAAQQREVAVTAQLQAVQAELANTQTALDEARTELYTVRADLAAYQRHQRMSAVRALFEGMGREFTEDAASTYLEMSEPVFNVVRADLLAMAHPATDPVLFQEVAVEGAPTDPQSKLELAARALMKERTGLSYEMAVARVLTEQPSLYSE